MDKKEQTRLRVQRYREKIALQDSVTTPTPDSVTQQGCVTQHHVTLSKIDGKPIVPHTREELDRVTRIALQNMREHIGNVKPSRLAQFASLSNVPQEAGSKSLIDRLTDDEDRKGLESICERLGRHGSEVRYGIEGSTFQDIKEMCGMIEASLR